VPESCVDFGGSCGLFLTNDKCDVSVVSCDVFGLPDLCACWLPWIVVLAEETGLQRFEGAADDGYTEVGGEQRALARLEQVAEDARGYAAHAKAPNTLKAYRIDWADFSAWCALHRLEFLPAAPQTVALYLTVLARTHSVSTLYLRLSGFLRIYVRKCRVRSA